MTSGEAKRPTLSRASAALLALGAFSLFAGLNAALQRLGLAAPVDSERLAVQHGIMMVLGFVGTVIALERAVALGRRAGRIAPAGLGLGAVALAVGAPSWLSGILFCLGCLGMMGVYLMIWRRQPAYHLLIQTAGAIPALGSVVLWMIGAALPQLVPWWAAFLFLTIAGERLELARVGQVSPAATAAITAAAFALVVTPVLATLWPTVGTPLFAAGLALLAGLLLRHDIARKTIRARGVTRFMAACLLTGYVWIFVAAGIWFVAGPDMGQGSYDAAVHAVFLGFVLSMIFAHAPVILPAVLRVPLPYHPVLWLSAALLHLGLLVRIIGGDLYGSSAAWQIGGTMSIVAILGFVLTAVLTRLLRSRRGTGRDAGLTATSRQEVKAL